MDQITSTDLKHLAERRDETSQRLVSLCMPTYRAGPETRQNAIRYKTLLSEAGESLRGDGADPREPAPVLERLMPLVEDNEFWQHQSEGLAVFAADDWLQTYRLPFTVEPRWAVGADLLVSPLLPVAADSERFFVLALSRSSVRLFDATRYSSREVEHELLPESLEDAVGSDWEERSLQFHTSTPSGEGNRASEFHGHGVGQDDTDGELVTFLKRVDDGVGAVMPDDSTPLVVAAVDELAGEYRKLSKRRGLVEATVRGNPDRTDAADLREAAWEAMAPLVEAERGRLQAKVRELLGSGRAVDQIQEVVVAAADGPVDTQHVARGERLPGHFDPASRTTTVDDAGPDDLLNRAVLETLRHDGTALAVASDEVPSDRSPVAALLRY